MGVSAMEGGTDQLLCIACSIITCESVVSQREIEALKTEYLEAAEVVTYSPGARTKLQVMLETTFTYLEQDIECLYIARAKSDGVLPRIAAVAAWGELFSVLLVAAVVRACGIKAEAVRDEVIITEASCSKFPYVPGTVIDAEPLDLETRANATRLIAPLLKWSEVLMMVSFIGHTQGGIVATLGRNGSDYSTAVIGAALDCTQVEIYTDVDGILIVDPRVVPDARLLPCFSYDEAALLSWSWAHVLHPRTLILSATRNMLVRVRNTFGPQICSTIVGPVSKQRSGVTTITPRRHLALITMESRHFFDTSKNVGQIFALAARSSITPVAIGSSSGHHLAFIIKESMVDSAVELLPHDSEHWKITSRSRLEVCICIGSGFLDNSMSPACTATTPVRERIPLITHSASDLGIILVIKDRDSEPALCSLHRNLVTSAIPSVRHHAWEDTNRALGKGNRSPTQQHAVSHLKQQARKQYLLG